MAGPHFNTEFDPRYGELVDVSPLLRRIVCPNPSKFTFHGTGTYVIGRGDVAVVDPGPRNADHVAALLEALDAETVRHILITHTHGDHSPAAAAVADATGAPVLGYGPHPADAAGEDDSDDNEGRDAAAVEHTDTGEDRGKDGKHGGKDGKHGGEDQLPGDFADQHRPDVDFEPDSTLRHGDVVEGPGYTVEALHTPGHISNHLCFALREEGCVLSGDHVMGWSTTIIPPPDGDVAAYLESLRLLLDRPGNERLYPTHGGPVHDADAHVTALYRHRMQREAGIVGLLRDRPRSATEIVTVLYADVDRRLHKAAARSVVAHLRKLHNEGRAHPAGDTTRNRTVWELQ